MTIQAPEHDTSRQEHYLTPSDTAHCHRHPRVICVCCCWWERAPTSRLTHVSQVSEALIIYDASDEVGHDIGPAAPMPSCSSYHSLTTQHSMPLRSATQALLARRSLARLEQLHVRRLYGVPRQKKARGTTRNECHQYRLQ